MGNFSCKTNNSIYCLQCKKCKQAYIGQTNNTYRRINEHINAIHNQDHELVHTHFNTTCNLNDVSFFVIATVADDRKRKVKEASFIKRFATIQPHGLNTFRNSTKDKINLIIPFTKNTLDIANSIKSLCEDNNIPTRLCYKNKQNIRSLFRNY